MSDPRRAAVLAAIDAANAADPHLDADGRPVELVYGERMSAELARLAPDASDHLVIAARGQHVERWKLPREDYPEGRAGYLAWRLREGATLEQALEGCLTDLDGFYTFLVGTADGFAVLRDPIACKPAVLAETDEWVAMGSEWRAIAVLPGAAEARMWEPEPEVVYAWERAVVA